MPRSDKHNDGLSSLWGSLACTRQHRIRVMFCIPFKLLANYAVLVAAIISAACPSQLLVCRHCMVHDSLACLASVCGLSSTSDHAQTCDHHACEVTCQETHDEQSDDCHHSHDDCPCCIGSIDNPPFLNNSSQAFNLFAEPPVWQFIANPGFFSAVACRRTCTAPTTSSSMPNVMRI